MALKAHVHLHGKHTHTHTHMPTLFSCSGPILKKSMNQGLILETETGTFPSTPPGMCLKVGSLHMWWAGVSCQLQGQQQPVPTGSTPAWPVSWP